MIILTDSATFQQPSVQVTEGVSLGIYGVKHYRSSLLDRDRASSISRQWEYIAVFYSVYRQLVAVSRGV